jgi:hypothetical protein
MKFSEVLFKILSWFSKPEQPTEQEHRAWSLEKVRQERKEVWICEDCKKEAQASTAAYDKPPPRTDPVLHLRLEAQRRRQEEEAFKRVLDVNTKELHAIRAHPGGIMRSGTTRKYVTQQLERLDMLEVTQPRVRKVQLVSKDEKAE